MSTAPVVLLHGVGLDHTMWGPVRKRLGRESFALDLPGHGSRPPLRTPQTLSSLAEDVLERLPEGRVHLVGFSLGALIAQHVARFHPERVLSLTCVSSVCKRTPSEREAVEGRLRTAGDAFASGVEAAIQRWYPSGSSVRVEDIEATRRSLLANDIESYLHAYTVFARGDAQIADELGAITTPTLAITGEHDPGSTPEMSRRLGDAISGARVVIVPNTRHMLPVEESETFVRELTTFIDESEGARS